MFDDEQLRVPVAAASPYAVGNKLQLLRCPCLMLTPAIQGPPAHAAPTGVSKWSALSTLCRARVPRRFVDFCPDDPIQSGV